MTQPPIAVVAEPNPILGEAIADSLEVLGFEPIVVPSEQAAAEVLRVIGEPDLLVCDANFGAVPRPYAYVRATLARVPYLPVVIASTPDTLVPPDLKDRIAIAEKPFGQPQLISGVLRARTLVETAKPNEG